MEGKDRAYRKWGNILNDLENIRIETEDACSYCSEYQSKSEEGGINCSKCPLYPNTCGVNKNGEYISTSAFALFLSSFSVSVSHAKRIKEVIFKDIYYEDWD